MADSEIATKSLENDAAENVAQTTIPGDTPAQTGASLGEHCVTDRPSPSGEKPTGEMSKFGDVDVYISKPSDYPHSPSKPLILLTGGTGLHSTNNQLQADRFAQEGFLVVMPDLFAGDPAPNSSSVVEDTNTSIIEQVKLKAAETAKSFMIDMWLARHTPEKVLPILHKVLDGMKDEFADAIANAGGIYGAGYCFGAKYIILLAGDKSKKSSGQKLDDEEAGATHSGPYIKAGAVAHGTLVTLEDFEGLKVPLTFACVENDQLFPENVREDGEKYALDNSIEAEFQIYPGVPHGFAVVGEYDDSKIKDAQSRAFEQILSWLKKH